MHRLIAKKYEIGNQFPFVVRAGLMLTLQTTKSSIAAIPTPSIECILEGGRLHYLLARLGKYDTIQELYNSELYLNSEFMSYSKEITHILGFGPPTKRSE